MQSDNETLATLIASQGRVEGKLDILTEHVRQAHLDNETRLISHESRISRIESKANIATGIVSILAFIVAPIITLWNKGH